MAPNSDHPKKDIDEETKLSRVRGKVFQARESVLTELLNNKHILTVYRIFATLLLGISINIVWYDYFYNKRINLGYTLLARNFQNFGTFVIVWICGFLMTVCIYLGFQIWATTRQLLSKSLLLYVWDKLWIGAFIAYIYILLYYSVVATYKYNFGYAVGGAISCEVTRFIMKSYAFIRTIAPRIINNISTQESSSFSHYLYFLFVPTLIYRDSYPRTKNNIRWHLVATYFIEFIAALVFCSFIYERMFVPLQDYGLKPYRWIDVITITLNNTLYSMVTGLLLFYVLLHLWSNAFAEMLQFSDRLFYEDWWTSTTHERYYRTWNSIVHDWLFHYIYKDVYEVIVPGNKLVARVAVFFLSSLFHEYISSNAIGFFLPTFLVSFFLVGAIMGQLKLSSNFTGNVFVWYSLAIGTSIIYTMNGLEYYCRLNYIKEELTFYSFFTPKLLQCEITF